MRIAVIGTPKRVKELREKISSDHDLVEVKNKQFDGFDLVFDLSFEEDIQRAQDYYNLSIPVVVNAVNHQLEAVVTQPSVDHIYGMNCLPTFINRNLAELTSLNTGSRDRLEALFTKLDWEVRWVESRVGMVTPRVVFMIINEAYYTLQEGTASKADINTGMRLGTAYPKGPFEWVEEAGIDNVYQALEAIYNDTKDERYKICPLLKTEYLRESINQ